jgi:hypothetical protein
VKWILVAAAVAAALVISTDAIASRDESCPDAYSQSTPERVDGSASLADTALAALGTHLAGTDEITRDHSRSKGFETVTFRGYAGGELVGKVVVSNGARGWYVERSDMCDRSS